MNSIGRNIVFTDFGESHGNRVGGIVDGMPALVKIDNKTLQTNIKRRAGYIDLLSGKFSPSPCPFVSQRSLHESDKIEWVSGVKNGYTLGSPIAFLVKNNNADTEHYRDFEHKWRPGHADWTYEKKYQIRDWRGGGRASARETVARVIAGSIVEPLLKQKNISINAHLIQIGSETDSTKFQQTLLSYLNTNNSIGAIIECTIDNVPVGVGEPIFDKLQSRLAYAVMSINGCKGFDYGTGFDNLDKTGSELYRNETCPLNNAGGIEGGISNGLRIHFRCVFKPSSSIINDPTGRHDTCIAIRAIPVVEAMTSLTIADLLTQTSQPK